MASITPTKPVKQIHGKLSKDDDGYFYVTATGKQKYRTREENYQQTRSPKQRWQTESFVWAHQQTARIWQNPQTREQTEVEWQEAMRRDPWGKEHADPRGWKNAMLQAQWKDEHPYDTWLAAYLQTMPEQNSHPTTSNEAEIADLQHQLDVLNARAAAIKARIIALQNPQQ